MKRILMTIAYDGTNYSGWQKQKDPNIHTVEGVFEEACRQLFRQEVTCIGASRTDAGVHAMGQRAVVDVETTIPAERVPLAIRSFLPKDVVVQAAEEVALDFHPRYDCVKKTYRYAVLNAEFPNPLVRQVSEFVGKPLDVERMQKAAQGFIGTHDFKAFCATGSTVKSTVRTIFDCWVKKSGAFIEIFVTGDGFLYNMVRILAGTLIAVGEGKIPADGIANLIEGKDRKKAGPTAEPQGLTLMTIEYE